MFARKVFGRVSHDVFVYSLYWLTEIPVIDSYMQINKIAHNSSPVSALTLSTLSVVIAQGRLAIYFDSTKQRLVTYHHKMVDYSAFLSLFHMYKSINRARG